MKAIVKFLCALVLGGFVTFLTGCSDHLVDIAPEVIEKNEKEVLRIQLRLSDEVDSRLSYEEINGKSIKTYWEEGDQIVASCSPNSDSYAYVFDLVEGAGTQMGTFECSIYADGEGVTGYKPENIGSIAWTIYYPGSKIKKDSDYFNFTYEGQVQSGNANYAHIGDFHSLRVSYQSTDYLSFYPEMIDFSSSEVEQSSCMKFILSGFEKDIVPTQIDLMYMDSNGKFVSCFHNFNVIPSYSLGAATQNQQSTPKLSLGLDGFEATNSITAYLMMSNCPVDVEKDGKFRVYVTDKEGNKYYSDVAIHKNTTLKGGLMYRITCKSWTKEESISLDGMDNPEKGIVVLQEATKGSGTDIVIMGDGFAEEHFMGNYDDVMKQAYEDFFSVEPYASLKDYYNVYYINAVSPENHDAVPLLNGAVQGDASTKFNTQFTQGSTSISGNNDLVLEYAKQAIRYKGGKGGVECTDDEAAYRVNSALCMVMVNVATHAGTCTLYWYKSTELDHAPVYSIAYTSLNPDDEIRRLTTVHEAGGHGFGKLADEYGGQFINGFNTASWTYLSNQHSYGVYRNVNEYWGENERQDGWSFSWTDTTSDNVYWSELLSPEYSYISNEGLGIYRGAFTYDNLYCRSTDNSLMRSQFEANGQSFNAISRWAIWYRLMRLTGGTTATQFKESLDEFVAWDSTIDGWIPTTTYSIRKSAEDNGLLPLAPPVLIECRLENGRLVEIK